MRVLVLGHKGMLGNCVVKYLSKFHDIITTDLRFPDNQFKNFISEHDGIIVNCIGAIPQKTDKFDVNVDLPKFLSTLDLKVIHPSTDCEGDDTPYGISKRKAIDIVYSSNNIKAIKTSIIGKELNTHDSLLDWALHSTGTIQGYTNAMWNGITTLEWSKYCNGLITNWDNYDKKTVLTSDCISKYELLKIICEVFDKSLVIEPIDKGVDKCLDGNYTKPIINQLQELKNFYD